jgi:hypothetical protein
VSSQPAKPYMAVSVQLQRLANEIDAHLRHHAGQRCGFFLVLQTPDGVTQYIGNGKRAESTQLMREMLDRWSQGQADIPAHINPTLKQPPTA